MQFLFTNFGSGAKVRISKFPHGYVDGVVCNVFGWQLCIM